MSQLDFTKVEYKTSYGLSSQLPSQERPEFVFSGRSNVGKSSLINKLCNRKKLAKVSGTPGKTATINFFDAGECYLVDLPGYGYAKVSFSERQRWDKLINGYFQNRADIRLIVQLLDCRHEPSAQDYDMMDYLDHYKLPFIVALTKGDKIKKSQLEKTMQNFSSYLAPYTYSDIILTSATSGMGINLLQETMQSFAATETE